MPQPSFYAYKNIAVSQITPAAKNPRTHSAKQIEQLRGSIREFGFTNPLLIDEHCQLIAGHGRLQAAIAEGYDTVPVIEVAGLTADQRRALIIADNQLALNAGWDAEILAEQLKALDAQKFDLSTIGFSQRELQSIMGSGAVNQAQPALYSDDAILAAAFDYWRARGFPYPTIGAHEMMQQINTIRATLTDNLLNSSIGNKIADCFNHHRFSAKTDWGLSPLDGFNHDKKFKRYLVFLLKHGKIDSDDAMNPGMITGAQACSNFRPGFAAYLYRRFCEPDANVLDTSTGYGGRLVGAIGSGVVASYTGIDPNTLTYAGNKKMISALGDPVKVQLICKPAEDVKLKELKSAPFDFAFTSPPYFCKERYSDEPTQSWIRYKTGEAWRDGFLAKMLALQFSALKPNSFNLVNIEDVKIGKESYPLVEWTKQLGIAAGFEFERMEAFPLAASNWVGESAAADRFEHVLVFRKP